jgi:hypothetical protein
LDSESDLDDGLKIRDFKKQLEGLMARGYTEREDNIDSAKKQAKKYY